MGAQPMKRGPDLTGVRYGRLLVVNEGPKSNAGKRQWNCLCDCGKESLVDQGALKRGATKSCGCLSTEKKRIIGSHHIDLTGAKFGRWAVQRRDPKLRATKAAYWFCLCNCGTLKSICGSALRKGSSKSCGCLASELTSVRTKELFSLPRGVAAFNDLFHRYKRQAKQREYEFNLTKEHFKMLVTSDCYYCGTPPAQVVQSRYGRNGGVTYNGVDRQNNAQGYTADNVVPCCGMCNRAKRDASVAEFIEWATRITRIAKKAAT